MLLLHWMIYELFYPRLQTDMFWQNRGKGTKDWDQEGKKPKIKKKTQKRNWDLLQVAGIQNI
jgi:hypothetical protein